MVTVYVHAGVTSETKIQYSSITEIFSFQECPRFAIETGMDSAETRPCISESSFKEN